VHGSDKGMCTEFWPKPEGKDHLGDLSVDGRIILIWVLKKLFLGFIWLRMGTVNELL
jgi:hypothetical protein